MIGNDVVDLQLASRQSNWRRKGFLEKVFSAEEQQQIIASTKPDGLVWLFWSMKEAAYKAHQRRLQLPRKINWQEFRCSLSYISEEAASGMVKTESDEYFTISEISKDYVHTSAETQATTTVKNGIFETSSAGMKQRFLQHISEAFQIPELQLQLQKNQHGIPYVTCQKEVFFEAFSFSEHGRFSAFSMVVNDL